MRWAFLVVVFGMVGHGIAGTTGAPPPEPWATDDSVRELLTTRIERDKRAVGLAVGILTPQGQRVICAGSSGTPRPIDKDTLFEIGSVTKVFTAILLAEMASRAEVDLDTPVAALLPQGTTVPVRGREIQLRDLATHASALPRMPTNLRPADLANPYADYTVEQLYAFLGTYPLQRDVGVALEYSNLGYGLLGHALALRAGTDYETVLRGRVLTPLSMPSTVITLTPELRERLAIGHDQSRNPTSNWDLPTLAGAGALRSTVDDLLTFLAACMGQLPPTAAGSGLAGVLAESQARTIEIAGERLSLAWGAGTEIRGRRVLWHNGGTGGYRSFVAFEPDARRAVVVLSNCSIDVDDLGFHLVDPSMRLTVAREAKPVAPAVLERYVGVYETAPGEHREVLRYRDRLFVRRPAQPPVEVFAASDTAFFNTDAGFDLVFEPVSDGSPPTLALTLRDGRVQRGRKVDRAPSAEYRLAEVDPRVYDGLVGRYALSPAHRFTVTRDGDRLMVQLTGQPAFELFPESNDTYVLMVAEARISFDRDPRGRAVALTLHQSGIDQRAQRMPDPGQ